MPGRISSTRRTAIIKARLQGLGRNEVARQTGENSVTVSREIDRFERLARKSGVWEAGTEYGVLDRIEDLYEIAEACREFNVSPGEMIEAAPVAKALKDADVQGPDIKLSIAGEIASLRKGGLSGERLVSTCIELANLMEKYGPFEELRIKYEELGQKVPQLRGELEQLKKEIAEAKSSLEALYLSKGVTEQNLQRFQDVNIALRKAGLNLDDLQSAVNTISSMKELGFNARQIVLQLRRTGKLKEQINSLEGKRAELELKKDELTKQINEARAEISELKLLLDEGEKLRNLGLSIIQIQRIRDAILKISASHGLSAVQAVEKFYKDILDHYDLLLDLEVKVSELDGKCAELRKDKEKIESSISELKEEYRRIGGTIDAYVKLKARGLKAETLLLLQRLVIEAGLAVTDVITVVKDLAQLEERKKERTQELDTLSREAERKRLLVQDLTERTTELKQEISQFLEGLLGKLKESSEKLTSSMAASGENAQREADASVRSMNASVEQLNATITNATENVEKAVGAIGAEIQRLLEKARAASASAIIAAREAGKLELQANIWRFLAGKHVDRASIFALLSSFVTRLLKWAEDENLMACAKRCWS